MAGLWWFLECWSDGLVDFRVSIDCTRGWPDWAKQLAKDNEKLGEYYRDLHKDEATQEKFDFALRNSSDLSKVNWKLAMK